MPDGAGFEVCEAGSVSEALAVLDQRQDVTVVVSDVQMPGRMIAGNKYGAMGVTNARLQNDLFDSFRFGFRALRKFSMG